MKKFATSRVRQAYATALTFAGLAAACAGATAVPEEPVTPFDSTGTIVTFIFRLYPEDTMRVLMRSPFVDEARARMQQADPPRWGFLGKRFLRGSGIDPNYAFHWDPDWVFIADAAVNCHTGRPPMRTDEEVDWWIEHGDPSIYCASAFPIAIEEPRE